MRTLLRSTLIITLLLVSACGGSERDGRRGPADLAENAAVVTGEADPGAAEEWQGEAEVSPAPLSRTPFLGARPSSLSAALSNPCADASPSAHCR